MTELHETRMGRELIERTLPELVKELARLNTNPEALLAAQERGHATDAEPDGSAARWQVERIWRARGRRGRATAIGSGTPDATSAARPVLWILRATHLDVEDLGDAVEACGPGVAKRPRLVREERA